MGKTKIGIYCYLVADILANVFQKNLLSFPLSSIHFVQTVEFDWLLNVPRNIKSESTQNLVRSHKGDEAETLQ